MDRSRWLWEARRLVSSGLPSSQWVGTVRRVVARSAADDLGTHLVASAVFARAVAEQATEWKARRRRKSIKIALLVGIPLFVVGLISLIGLAYAIMVLFMIVLLLIPPLMIWVLIEEGRHKQ